GTIVFSEGFEGKGIPHEIIDVDKTMSGGVEVASPVEDYVGQNVPAGTYESESDSDVKYVITYGSGAYGKVTYGTSAYGNSSFFLYGADNNVGGTTGSARITLKLGQKTADNKYVISFDVARNTANGSDYATLNEEDWSGSAKLTGTSKWSTISRGAIGTGNKEWTHYYATLSTTSDPQLDFSVFGWGAMCIDNIVVKDSDGNIIFQEGFECGAPPAIIDVEATTSGGKEIDSPLRAYIGKNVPNRTLSSERNADVMYTPTYGTSAYAKVVNTVSAGGSNSLYLYGANNTAADGKGAARITLNIGTKTADNKYVISFDARRENATESDYATLNEISWQENARIGRAAMWASSSRGVVGNGSHEWTHYVATLTTEADPKLDFAVFGWAKMYIDNIVVRDTDGNIIFSEGFEGTELPVGMSQIKHTTSGGEIIDCPVDEYIGEKVPAGTIESWKKPTVQYVATYGEGGYAKVDSTIAAYGENSLKLFGADKNVGGTTGSARLTLKLGEKTSDNNYVISFDVYREVTDSRDYITLNEWNWESTARLDNGTLWNKTVLGTAGKGDKSWTHYEATISTAYNPQLDISVFGWGVLYIDNIVIKDTSENIVFSEGFEDSGFARSVIYDAQFELVEKAGDGYTVVGAANALTANTFVKTSVKLENMAAQKGAKGNIYTALYKDNLLVTFEAQTISAAKGEEVSSSQVIGIPALGDGEYTLRVYVWDDNLNALKDVMLIGE
ncbi:MAG: hypothetical protein IKY39_05820, partial [Clostridia bacterium]|nr:hypothetical protein [Clostridia bacterium]